MKIRWCMCVAHWGFRFKSNGELAYKACAFCESVGMPLDPHPWHRSSIRKNVAKGANMNAWRSRRIARRARRRVLRAIARRTRTRRVCW